ncbi:MAG: (2Fe-2S)-binding protein [Puniceicoccaceae bacterium]
MDFELNINGKSHKIKDVDPTMPLLWILRDILGLTGTKYSCGDGSCGTCVILMNGMPMRSCVLPVAAAMSAEIITIEGLSEDGDHPVQEAWIEEDVAQCGFCQGGVILETVALLKKNPDPSDQQIDQALAGNLCRCGTYPRIRKAVKNAARRLAQ